MILEFTQAFGTWKSGDITDEVKEGTGRALIADGVAKESTESAQLRALVKAEAERTRTETLELTRSMLQGQKPTIKGPPDGGGGVNFETISATSTPAYEEKKGQCFSDVLRCIHAVGSRGTPPELASWAGNRLRRVYSEEEIEYKMNDQTGTFDSVVTRGLPNGGKEVITRTGTDSLGGGATYGFTVKPEYLGSLFEIAREQEVFAGAARAIPVSQGIEVKYPALGQYSAPALNNGVMVPAVFGGITMAYKNETAARVESDASTEEIDFKIVDLTGATSFSRDYIVDNFIAMDSVVTRLFGDALAWIEDWICIHGNGEGQPQGFFNANATIQITRKNSSKIASDDLGAMIGQLSSQCWRSARWLTNVSCIPQLFILNNAAGTPVFQPNALIAQNDPLSIIDKTASGGMINRPMGSLVGFPVYFTEKVSILGTVGDICLVCPDQYGLAKRSGIEIGVSEHFYFSTDKIAYRFKMRHDGRSLWRAPYTQADNIATPGSGTQVSPFLMLK